MIRSHLLIRPRIVRTGVGAAALLLAAPLALTGCSGGDTEPAAKQQDSAAGQGGDGVHRGEQPPEPEPEPEPDERPQPPEDFSAEAFRVPSKSEGKLSDMKVGKADQQGVETVRFDLGTEQLPAYHVRYVDQVRAHPADEPIDVDGEAYLEVGFELTDPNERGRLAIPPDTRPDQKLVRQTLLVRNVGGELRFAIGLSKKAEFRARQDGTSLVVELRPTE